MVILHQEFVRISNVNTQAAADCHIHCGSYTVGQAPRAVGTNARLIIRHLLGGGMFLQTRYEVDYVAVVAIELIASAIETDNNSPAMAGRFLGVFDGADRFRKCLSFIRY